MAQIMVECPRCGKPVSTGITIDRRSFNATSLENTVTRCPCCRKSVAWGKPEAYLASKK